MSRNNSLKARTGGFWWWTFWPLITDYWGFAARRSTKVMIEINSEYSHIFDSISALKKKCKILPNRSPFAFDFFHPHQTWLSFEWNIQVHFNHNRITLTKKNMSEISSPSEKLLWFFLQLPIGLVFSRCKINDCEAPHTLSICSKWFTAVDDINVGFTPSHHHIYINVKLASYVRVRLWIF